MNGWVNSREAGGLRRHLAHHDVIVLNNILRICCGFVDQGMFFQIDDY